MARAFLPCTVLGSGPAARGTPSGHGLLFRKWRQPSVVIQPWHPSRELAIPTDKEKTVSWEKKGIRDGIENKGGSTEPDMEEKITGTPGVISNWLWLYDEILLPFERRFQWFFSPNLSPFQKRNRRAIDNPVLWKLPAIFPIDSTSLEISVEFRSISKR